MKEKLTTFLSSYKAAVLFLSIYAVMMAVATLIEKYHGTDTAKALVYYSPLFILLHFLMVINFICITIKKHLFRAQKWGYVMAHMAMIVILVGAFTTHIFSFDGMLHLREGNSSNIILVKKGKTFEQHVLPFSVKLNDFILTRYPGSSSPSSYESILEINIDGKRYEELVYMNHILDLKGYRFYQASFDQDEKGSILSVSYDVAGRRITYTGYFLLVISLIGCIISKGSRFRVLNRRLSAMTIFIFLFAIPTISAQSLVIPEQHAERFGAMPMQDRHGRIVPVSTFASEIVRKLQLRETVTGISDNQILLNIICDPASWSTLPILIIDNEWISRNVTGGREVISYRDAFDENGNYRYGGLMENIYKMIPSARTASDKDMMKLDERINILHQLFNFRMLRLFPVPNDTVSHHWMSAGDSEIQLTDSARMAVLSLFNGYRNAVLEASVSGSWNKVDSVISKIEQYQMSNLNGLTIDRNKIDVECLYNRFSLLSISKRLYFIFGGILLLLSLLGSSKKKAIKVIKTVSIAVVILALCLHAVNIGMRG